MLVVVRTRDNATGSLTCLRDGEGEGCRRRGRESRVRPFPTCAYGQRRVCGLGRRCEVGGGGRLVGRRHGERGSGGRQGVGVVWDDDDGADQGLQLGDLR